MPVVKSKYQSPALFRNYHISTIYSATIRRVQMEQQRERLELPDSDFLDVDWSYSEENETGKVLVVMHGLEGSAKRPYITGTAKYFTSRGWDVAAVNLRGCSGELNRRFRSYHAGATDDLDHVIQHILTKQKYDTIALNGFSLGGNLVLKYLGEGREIPGQIKAAVVVSVPCDLYASLQKLEETRNLLYAKRFVLALKSHLLKRAEKFPQKITKKEIAQCSSLMDIDNIYTSRAHDFENALDYYQKNSSLQFLSNIKIPTLLINAKNDGFLSKTSYPIGIAEENENFYLEMPRYGGHVGFIQNGPTCYYEKRGFEFLESKV